VKALQRIAGQGRIVVEDCELLRHELSPATLRI
jgi:hypothetical protein